MGLSAQSLITGLVRTLLPSKMADSAMLDAPARVNGYGELAVRDTPASYFGLAEEGSLMVATNPTPSTGAAWVSAQTAFSDTAPNFYIANNEPAGGKTLRLHYLKLICTTAATSATAIHYAVIVDPVTRALGTDNTLAITPVSPNGALAIPSAAPTVKVQNNTTTSVIAASSANKRIVARGCLGGLNIAGDVLQICFGEITPTAMSATAVTAAGQPGRRIDNSPPVLIPAGGSAVIHVWMPGSSASIVPEFELVMSLK